MLRDLVLVLSSLKKKMGANRMFSFFMMKSGSFEETLNGTFGPNK